MIKVILVGRGNLAYHLERAFQSSAGIELLAVADSRKKPDLVLLEQADICILAVSDGAIKEVALRFPKGRHLMAHTSGSVPLEEISSARRAVFYPLQTFSKGSPVDFSNIPICIEAAQKEDAKLIRKVASSISGKVQYVSSVQRRQLHLAAIFANNFTNHCYQIASEVCEKHKLSFDILKPLISETADKVRSLSPFDAQTGPARRHDGQTIQAHLEMFEDDLQKEIYSLLSNSIQKTYGKKL